MLKIGSKQIVDAYVGTERIGKMYAGDLVFEAPLPGRLPKGYKEVEYVKWTDTSTRFALLETVNSGTDKIIYKFKPSAYGSANNVYSYLLLNNGTTTRSSCITFNSSAENKFNLPSSAAQTLSPRQVPVNKCVQSSKSKLFAAPYSQQGYFQRAPQDASAALWLW